MLPPPPLHPPSHSLKPARLLLALSNVNFGESSHKLQRTPCAHMTAVFDTLWREAADPSHIMKACHVYVATKIELLLKTDYGYESVFTQILFGELLGASSAQFAKKKKPIQP